MSRLFKLCDNFCFKYAVSHNWHWALPHEFYFVAPPFVTGELLWKLLLPLTMGEQNLDNYKEANLSRKKILEISPSLYFTSTVIDTFHSKEITASISTFVPKNYLGSVVLDSIWKDCMFWWDCTSRLTFKLTKRR